MISRLILLIFMGIGFGVESADACRQFFGTPVEGLHPGQNIKFMRVPSDGSPPYLADGKVVNFYDPKTERHYVQVWDAPNPENLFANLEFVENGAAKHKAMAGTRLVNEVALRNVHKNVEIVTGSGKKVRTRIDSLAVDLDDNGRPVLKYSLMWADSQGLKTKNVRPDSVEVLEPRRADEIFENAPGHQIGDNLLVMNRSAQTPAGKLPFTVTIQGMGEYGGTRIAAPRSLAQLKAGDRYTYVVLRSGEVRLGHIRNSWELGVKHGVLAEGEEVVAAGEIVKDADGSLNYAMNVESGTFSKKIQEKSSNDELLEKAQEALAAHFGRVGRPQLEGFPPAREPTPLEMVLYCQKEMFAQFNSKSCARLLELWNQNSSAFRR